MPEHILIVDDERALREELADFFRERGFACGLARCAGEALDLAGQRDFSVILADVQLPDMNGLEMVARLREQSPQSQVLIMTAHPSVDTVVSALRLGAFDYVIKPLVLEDLLHKVRHMIDFRTQTRELSWHRQELRSKYDFANIVGRSQQMQEVYHVLERVSSTDTPVLIMGESGTGKELAARAIHHNGPLRDARFITINCAALPPTLFESQLFGHVKGAFTGADAPAKGVFAAAADGTLFLDEVGDLPLELQPKLLRAIENQEILPVGAAQPVTVKTRILASTNKELSAEVEQGRFRRDLFYRLAVVTVNMPALRERVEDIPSLVEFFIRKLNRRLGRRVTGVTNEVLRRLLCYKWKGNVRELQNVLERAMILQDGDLITSAGLRSDLFPTMDPTKVAAPLKEAVREFERDYVERIVAATNGDKRLAAQLLGVSVSSIYRRLQTIEDEIEADPPSQV